MARLITGASIIQAAGNVPKVIEEYVGRVNSDTEDASIGRMKSPQGWQEPGQTPDFDEYNVVLSGTLHVETPDATFDVQAGQAIITPRGEWVRYSTPYGPAEYISVCIPAFSPQTVHRDGEDGTATT